MTDSIMTDSSEPVLVLQDLDIVYSALGKEIPAVRGVSFEIGAGEAFALVGESGSGKSTIAYAIMRYLASNGKIAKGRIAFRGSNIFRLTATELLSLRGAKMSLVPQEPLTSLNPSHRVGNQIAEVFHIHLDLSVEESYKRAIEMLRQVNMPDPEGMARKYPHEISGGQQQRVLIAMAFSTHPDLLIMDEPTTGLDVTTEARILDLIVEMKEIYNTAILYITHDLGVVKRVCERVAIIYAGEVVELGDVNTVFSYPAHNYTKGLLDCIPKISSSAVQERLQAIEGFLPDLNDLPPGCIFSTRCDLVEEGCREGNFPLIDIGSGHLTKCVLHKKVMKLIGTVSQEKDISEVSSEQASNKESSDLLLEVDKLKKVFRVGRKNLLAVDQVSLECRKGEILGIVGESGCGKTTLLNLIGGLDYPTRGKIFLSGQDMSLLNENQLADLRRDNIGYVFQFYNLLPLLTALENVMIPLHFQGTLSKRARKRKALELLKLVKLEERSHHTPSELSGGEQQRVAIARSFANDPSIVLLDRC